jgi:2-deoxy-D-gluconate 3-dehydrogenase
MQHYTDLSGKLAVVTGAGAGIGEAIAIELHAAGAYTVVLDYHHDNAHEVAKKLNSVRPDSAEAYHVDVADAAWVQTVIDRVIAGHECIDILVNNAGIYPFQPIANMSVQEFQRVIDVNLTGTFNLTKLVSDAMKQHHTEGSIVNITSIDAIRPSSIGLAHYDASKHGVVGFTQSAALELAQFGIRVNAVAPGGVLTPGVQAQMPSDAELTSQFLSRVPLQRFGDPAEIARAVLFFASSMSSYCTGAQLVVDGGALLM